jgi:hypothetical protein
VVSEGVRGRAGGRLRCHPAEMTDETGTTATGKRTAEEPADKGAADETKRSRAAPDTVTFLIPSGHSFELPRAALRCCGLHDSLLARLVHSALPTTTDAGGAIKVGFECSVAAFRRVMDEYMWAFHVETQFLGTESLERREEIPLESIAYSGPPLHAAVPTDQLHQLWDFLGLPEELLDRNRKHANTSPRVLAAQAALDRGFHLLIQYEYFVRALASTLDPVNDYLTLGTANEPARISIALWTTNPHHFTSELIELLQQTPQRRELCNLHSKADLADACSARRPNQDDLARLRSHQLRLYAPRTVFWVQRNFPNRSISDSMHPLGMFAIGVKRSVFYSKKSAGSALGGKFFGSGGRRLEFQTSSGIPLTLILTLKAAEAWGPGNSEPEVEITAALKVSGGVNAAASLAKGVPTIVIMLHANDFEPLWNDDEVHVKKRQWMRKTFFKDVTMKDYDDSCISKSLISYEEAGFDKHSFYEGMTNDYNDESLFVEQEIQLAPTPWSGASQEPSLWSGSVLDIDHDDEAQKQRVKIDPEDAGPDGLGGTQGFGFVSLLFSVWESDAAPDLEKAKYDPRNILPDDLLVLDIEAA